MSSKSADSKASLAVPKSKVLESYSKTGLPLRLVFGRSSMSPDINASTLIESDSENGLCYEVLDWLLIGRPIRARTSVKIK